MVFKLKKKEITISGFFFGNSVKFDIFGFTNDETSESKNKRLKYLKNTHESLLILKECLNTVQYRTRLPGYEKNMK